MNEESEQNRDQALSVRVIGPNIVAPADGCGRCKLINLGLGFLWVDYAAGSGKSEGCSACNLTTVRRKFGKTEVSLSAGLSAPPDTWNKLRAAALGAIPIDAPLHQTSPRMPATGKTNLVWQRARWQGE